MRTILTRIGLRYQVASTRKHPTMKKMMTVAVIAVASSAVFAASRGGFAVGGLSVGAPEEEVPLEKFIEDDGDGPENASKGGFAIGGLSTV